MSSGRSAESSFDVIVIGGGPAGSTAAAVAAMDGHRVLLLERERFPRYHIGESLLPSTVQGVCRFLGVDKEVERAGFVKKYGATFVWGGRDGPWTIRFGEAMVRGAKRRAHAFHVLRSRFDEILLRNAASRGAVVREGCRATGATREGRGWWRVRYSPGPGESAGVRCRYVIDATGQSGLLANRIGARRFDPFFQNIALFGYYRSGRRFGDAARRGNVLSAAFPGGWAWYIPLGEDLTSVGVVMRREDAGTIRRLGPARALEAALQQCPLVRDFLAPARRITRGELGTVRVVRDYSYSNRRLWAPGAVLVGDAALFIDPLFSSGVHFATYSGLLAARSVNSSLRREVPPRLAFGEFERRYRREVRIFYEFLVGFYQIHDDPESPFWKTRKITRNHDDGRRKALVRLISGMAQAEGEPAAPSEVLPRLEREAELLRAASGLDGPPPGAGATDRSRERLEGRLELMGLGEATRRGRTRLRSRSPRQEDGLVPSRDGLRWVRASKTSRSKR